jgi:uncharacterized protein YaiI (UPF0178 family)
VTYKVNLFGKAFAHVRNYLRKEKHMYHKKSTQTQILRANRKYLTADNSVFPYSNAKDMCMTQDLNFFGEIIAHAQCSVDEQTQQLEICKSVCMFIGLAIVVETD